MGNKASPALRQTSSHIPGPKTLIQLHSDAFPNKNTVSFQSRLHLIFNLVFCVTVFIISYCLKCSLICVNPYFAENINFAYTLSIPDHFHPHEKSNSHNKKI